MIGPVDSYRPKRRLALALGPGGTRGFAHLGVIKALLDAGLKIDSVTGASTGALFGALYAMDGTLAGVARGMNVKPSEIFGLFRDRLRLAPSNPLGARLAEHFAEARLESLPVPLSVVTVDLESGDEVLLREGPVRDAVAASIAIPVLARPVPINGRYLIDGGYGHRSPSAFARGSSDDVVLMVALGELGLFPPTMRGLVGRLADHLRRLPSNGTPDWRAVAYRVLVANARGFYNPHDADLVLVPNVGDINPHLPLAAAATFKSGERAARAALPAIRRLLQAPTTASRT